MKKNIRIAFILLLFSAIFVFKGFADGPDLDDKQAVLSGPGMNLGKGEQEQSSVNVPESAFQVYSGVLSGEEIPLPSDYAFSSYEFYGYNELSSDLMKLKETYPTMQLDSLGKTVDGRELYRVIVGNPNAPKKILVHAGIHAREYIVCKVAMRQVASLLEMQKTGKTYGGKSIAQMLENTCIHFVPMVNPDGISLVQYGIGGIGSEALRASIMDMAKRENVTDYASYFRLWKNNARGVNLNKNFDANWEQTVDRKGYPSKDEYKGSAAESEMESKALADLQRKENFKCTLSYHTQGEVIYWYFGEGSYVNDARRLAEIVHKNSNYAIIDYYNENHAGGFKDFTERKLNVPSVTIECGKGTSPVPEQQIDKIWQEQKGILPDLLFDYSK